MGCDHGTIQATVRFAQTEKAGGPFFVRLVVIHPAVADLGRSPVIQEVGEIEPRPA